MKNYVRKMIFRKIYFFYCFEIKNKEEIRIFKYRKYWYSRFYVIRYLEYSNNLKNEDYLLYKGKTQ